MSPSPGNGMSSTDQLLVEISGRLGELGMATERLTRHQEANSHALGNVERNIAVLVERVQAHETRIARLEDGLHASRSWRDRAGGAAAFAGWLFAAVLAVVGLIAKFR